MGSCDDGYFKCDLESQVQVATILRKVCGLSISDIFKLCCAPVNLQDNEVISTFKWVISVDIFMLLGY